MVAGQPAAGFKFNSFQEIKSHSSILFNERMAILFYLLDMKSIDMNNYYDMQNILHVRSLLKQIYKNMRMLIRYNPTVRATLSLDTKDPGIYIPDVAIGVIDNMVNYCNVYGYSLKKLSIIVGELNNLEMMLKDVLQYFNYFIRPDFRAKPDVDMATETYKEIADGRTVGELQELVGKNHKIDFNSLGIRRVELENQIEYEEELDGEEVAKDGT